MPSRETPSYSSSRVQRASRLNSLEQVRLQQRLMLLEKARLHQARLTNQDIRLTSLALDYILNCSGSSPEGRGPAGQQGGGVDIAQTEDPCFLYGERVVSRKVRRMPRPQSAAERRRPGGTQDSDSSVTGGGGEEDDTLSVASRLPPRPQSSPAKGRTWSWPQHGDDGAENGSGGSDLDSDRPFSRGRGLQTPRPSRPSTAESGRASTPGWGRVTPHQAWEDDTDEVTKRIIKAQHQQQKEQQQRQKQHNSRRSNRYMKDINRMQSQSAAGTPRGPPTSSKQAKGGGSNPASAFTATTPSPSPTPRPSSPVIEDRKPVSPSQKRVRSGGMGRRAGLTEIMSQARATMTASAWRSHLASTSTVPRSAESQRQVILEARRTAEKQRQQHVMHKVETFMGQLSADT